MEVITIKHYPNIISEYIWPLILPLSPETVYHRHERRAIVNGILSVLRRGCSWRALPHDLPSYGTVFYSFQRWRHEGL
ncbi:MAG TPA: transposase [Ktedonobacteraceae bacterium]|nr:transposase [Ktedonobacteraceae bacterium]